MTFARALIGIWLWFATIGCALWALVRGGTRRSMPQPCPHSERWLCRGRFTCIACGLTWNEGERP